MYKGVKVLDVHQHLVVPGSFGVYQMFLTTNRGNRDYKVSDDEMDEYCQEHLRYCDERNIDCVFDSQRPVWFQHSDQLYIQQKWCETTNNVLDQQHRLNPTRIFGVAQLPQNVKLDTKHCVAELERCFKQLQGFVAAVVNPDPGADGEYPPMNHEYWYPLYEAAEKLGAPLIVHPSFFRDKWDMWGRVPSNYQMNNVIQEFITWNVLGHSDVFDIFPQLKVVICHCGGALSRFRVNKNSRERREQTGKLYFDTCAYDGDFLRTAIKQWGSDRMLFGTEAPGSGQAINPETGRSDDDLVPTIDGIEFLTLEEKIAILNTNIKETFTRFREPENIAPARPATPGARLMFGGASGLWF